MEVENGIMRNLFLFEGEYIKVEGNNILEMKWQVNSDDEHNSKSLKLMVLPPWK